MATNNESILTAGKSGKIPPGQILDGTPGNSEAEIFRFYYHPDHLGSTSYITDASGEVYQHLEYFAFGETFVEEHSNTHRTPYLFNGKELDEETGLYYYGARYYDAQTSVWLSIDPRADYYPGLSPYNFNLNNPVRFTDPDGREPTDDLIFNGNRLYYRNDAGKILWSVKAVSGRGKYLNDPSGTSVENEGPTPGGSYYMKLNEGIPTEKKGAGWGRLAVRLEPKFLTKVWNKLANGRGGFYLHEDGNEETAPGTAGCIGVTKENNGILKVKAALNAFQKAGNKEISLTVDFDYDPDLNYSVNTKESDLNVRTNGGGRVIDKAKKGESLKGTGNINGNWVEIEKSNGKTGWVHGDYLKKEIE